MVKINKWGLVQVDLDKEQIDLIIKTLLEKRNDLDAVLKNQDGLEAETIRDMLIEHREINNVIRELQFYFTKTEIETEKEGIDHFYNSWIHDVKAKEE